MNANAPITQNPMMIFCAILALLFGLAYAVWTPEPHGFFKRVLIFFFAGGISFVGAVIGDLLRKMAIPDAIFTTGGMAQILKQKLFWFIGPQVIGALIGGAIGSALIR